MATKHNEGIFMLTTRSASRTAVCALAVLFTAGLISARPARAEGHLPMEVAGAAMPSLAPIVKKASPAVVNISTRGTVAEKGAHNPLFCLLYTSDAADE